MSDPVKILVVENETPEAMRMVHLLTRAGCEVQTARTGQQGMELAQDTQFDLITLGVDLPDFSGFDICNELKQRHISLRTPVVFVSERSFEEDAERSFEVGVVDYITKPFEAADFICRILSHVGQAKALRREYTFS